MLSVNNPNSGTSIQGQRHRIHRRQNSTPVGLSAATIPNLPAQHMQQRQQSPHRRNRSVDQRRHSVVPQQLHVRGDGTVSMTTNNESLNEAYQQHTLLRETQQQSMAQPGLFLQPQQFSQSTQDSQWVSPNQMNLGDGNVMSMQVQSMEVLRELEMGTEATRQASFEKLKQDLRALFDNFNQENQMNKRTPSGETPEIKLSHHLDQPGMMPAAFQFPGNSFQADFSDQRRMSLQSEIGVQPRQPETPTKRNVNSGYVPMTPTSMSFKKSYSRTAQSSPTRQGYARNLQPSYVDRQGSPMQRGRSHQGVLQSTNSSVHNSPASSFGEFDLRLDEILSPELPVSQDASKSQMSSMGAPNLTINIPSIPPPHNSIASAGPSPTGELPRLTSSHSSFDVTQSSPVRPSALPSSNSALNLSVPSSPSKLLLSPKTSSLADLSLEDDMDATVEETGISIDQISAYIEPPNSNNNKWICHFPECGKEFGRKENIKSHVQTHLGDRQYVCNKCNKRFVRGHDMKRHARTHSGNKPYPCKCGQRFARQDALTRHRQRGMCCGAFTGITKVKAKRGRPKKVRPEMEDRLDKAAKSRSRDQERMVSGLLESPLGDFDSFSGQGSSPESFEELAMMSDDARSGLSGQMFGATPPASPGYSIGSRPSPQFSRSISPYSDAASPHKGALASIPELPDMSVFNLEMSTEKLQAMNAGDDVFMPAFQPNETPSLSSINNIDSYFDYNP